MPYNLLSPNGIVERCDLEDLNGWFKRELAQVTSAPEKEILSTVAGHLDEFVQWAENAILLWQGCDRIPEVGKKLKYFSYPDEIKQMARTQAVRLDTRMNGPAIAAFLLSGGKRPGRFGSSNAWSIHHIYSGKFPYVGRDNTLHAAKHCNHFTQSAGLIAAHPVADSLSDEFPFFAWVLRAKAFQRFGYDPDGVFAKRVDTFGFASGRSCMVISAAA